MKLGDLIDELTELRDRHGWDLPVQVAITTGPGAWRIVDLDRIRYSRYPSASSMPPRDESIALESAPIVCIIRPTT